MKRIFPVFALWLAAWPLAAQMFDGVDKAVPYVQLTLADSFLRFDPTDMDTFRLVEPGSFFALKGDYNEVSTFYSDGRPEEKSEWFEVRFAGKIALPDLPPPPIARLPRDRDGWISPASFRPRGVSFSEAAEDLLVALPFFEAEELEAADFFQFYESKELSLDADAAKRKVNAETFRLTFENGTERLVEIDSTFGRGRNARKVHRDYLGQYVTQGFYLVQASEGTSRRYELISRKTGATLATVEQPWAVPSVSPDGQWLTVSGGTTGQPLHYLHFLRCRDGAISEEFTVRLPFQKVSGVDWDDEEHILCKVQQDDPIQNTPNPTERYYRVFVKLPEQ